MPRLPVVGKPLLRIGSCALALGLLALAGCATSIGTSPQATATATLIPIPPTAAPITLAVRVQDIGGAKVAGVVPGPHGLLLIPPATSPTSSTPSSDQSYATSISFYNFTRRQLTKVATAPVAPDGSPGVVVYATYAGDWISYETASATQAPRAALWIYNVVSGQRTRIAGSGAPSGAPGAPFQFWVASDTDLVWASGTGSASSGVTSTLYDYTFATGQTRTLYTSSTAVIKPEAINATTVLFFQSDLNDANGTTWLQQLSQSQPVKISDEQGVGASMNANYAVWGDPHAGATYLYDLDSGKLSPSFANCLRPALDDMGPYMVCLNFSGYTFMLIQLPDGGQITYNTGGKSLGDGIAFYKGRGYFVGSGGNVLYFNLPMR